MPVPAQPSSRKRTLADLGLVYAAAIWGSTFFLVKDALAGIDPVTIASIQKIIRRLREDGIADIGLGYPLLRRMLQELGHRFVQTGATEQADDIFWMVRAFKGLDYAFPSPCGVFTAESRSIPFALGQDPASMTCELGNVTAVVGANVELKVFVAEASNLAAVLTMSPIMV